MVTGEQLQEIYNDINADKLMVRRKDTVHNEVLYSADGYVVAWFMWQLQGDEYAGKAFIGNSPELTTNEMYQDQQINLKGQ